MDAEEDQDDDSDEWIEVVLWVPAPDPAPSDDDIAWNDGYVAALNGGTVFPVGLSGARRDSWEAGYAAGLEARSVATQAAAARAAGEAIDQAGGIVPYLRQEHDRELGILPPGLARWIADHRADGHDSDA
jgi:hypothetical protein